MMREFETIADSAPVARAEINRGASPACQRAGGAQETSRGAKAASAASRRSPREARRKDRALKGRSDAAHERSAIRAPFQGATRWAVRSGGSRRSLTLAPFTPRLVS